MIAQGGRLPAEATRFFGRSVEVAAVKGALARSRLVTLTGPGGVGKTRLAVKVAGELARQFPDGIFLADLTPAGDAPGVLRAVAAAVGLPGPGDAGDDPAGAPLPAVLGQRKLLLILDTAEHLVDACAGVADALLRGGDGPVLLVTSRQPLELPGEVVFRIAPLPVGDDGGDAVALLTDRAGAAVGSAPFAVTADMRPGLVRLCRELDGLPLSIELAAPRLRAVGLDELLARLPGQLRLLAAGRRTAAGDRLRSLEASVAWSYALCTPDEQRLWAALAVFADGFDLRAAEAVCGSAPAPGPRSPAAQLAAATSPAGDRGPGDRVPADRLLTALVGLVDKSVVLRVADADGAARYRLLAAAREYGAARATAAAAVAGRHRRHYLARARAMAAGFSGPAQLRLVDQLGRDEANLRLAFDGALAAGDTATASGLAVACWPWLVSTGRLAQARSWLAWAPAGQAADLEQRSGQGQDKQPERGRGSARPASVTSAAGPASPRPAAEDIRVLLAWVLSAQGDLAAANALSGRAERPGAGRAGRSQRADGAGDAPAGPARPSGGAGGVSPAVAGRPLTAVAGELTGALAALRRGALDDCGRRCAALAATLPDGERWARGWASWAGGVAAWCGGHVGQAGMGLRTGLELLAPFGDEFAVAQHLEALAWLAVRRGDSRRAARLQGAADRRWGELVASDQVRAPRSGLLVLDVERDQAERRARDDLGPAGYAAEYATGAELRTAAAVSLALPGLASPYRAREGGQSPGTRSDAHERALAALAAAPLLDQGLLDQGLLEQGLLGQSPLQRAAGDDGNAGPAQVAAGSAPGVPGSVSDSLTSARGRPGSAADSPAAEPGMVPSARSSSSSGQGVTELPGGAARSARRPAQPVPGADGSGAGADGPAWGSAGPARSSDRRAGRAGGDSGGRPAHPAGNGAGPGSAGDAGPDPDPGEEDSPGQWELLTAREREVAVLVAAGLTNKDIAARLVVSKRTVDAHVEHILGKLGYNSRVQVAALASRAQASGTSSIPPQSRPAPAGGARPARGASGGARRPPA